MKKEQEGIEKQNEINETFELTWDVVSKNKADQHVKNIKASHEVRGDMVEGYFDFE